MKTDVKMYWKICEANPRLQKVLSDALGVSPLFAQLLLNRDIKTPEEAQDFLFGELSSCPDPFLMKDMDRGVERIKRAIENKEKILKGAVKMLWNTEIGSIQGKDKVDSVVVINNKNRII